MINGKVVIENEEVFMRILSAINSSIKAHGRSMERAVSVLDSIRHQNDIIITLLSGTFTDESDEGIDFDADFDLPDQG